IAQPRCCAANLFEWWRGQFLDQLSKRHRTDEMASFYPLASTVADDANARDAASLPEDAIHATVHVQRAPIPLNYLSDCLPHHARTAPGIMKRVNQRFDDVLFCGICLRK